MMKMIQNFSTPSPQLNPKEEIFNRFKNFQQLDCDPIYLAAQIGNVFLLDQELIQNGKNEKNVGNSTTPAVHLYTAIKISIKKNSTISISKPSCYQGFLRCINRENREELLDTRPHLIKLLRWFDYSQEPYKTIIKTCKLGLEVLLKGYQNENGSEIILIQNNHPLSSKRMIQFNIFSQTENDPVIRSLENDIDLLEEALLEKDESSRQKFSEKLAKEEKRFFSLHKIVLLNDEKDSGDKEKSKDIDTFLKNEVSARWEIKTVKGIAEFFLSDSLKNFNFHESIQSLIMNIPKEHEKLKEEIEKRLKITLENENVVVNYSK